MGQNQRIVSHIINNYPHQRGIHCETGSIKNMLTFHGFNISETMIFGIGSGYDFMHFPFPMFNGCETPLFRNTPGKIFSQFSKRMRIKRKISRFLNSDKAMKVLDSLLEKNIPVAVVVEILLLPFFPLKDRNFPAHTIAVIGKEGDEYIVSDCDYHFPDDSPHRILSNNLKKARYPKTLLSPQGKMFYIKSLPEKSDMKTAIIKGIKDTCHQMLDIPFPFFGVKGIYFLSKRLRLYDKKYGRVRALDNIKWQIQTSEEAGTGGSGYRYMYATFLKEAAQYLQDEKLLTLSVYMRKIADKWQLFAVEALRFQKSHKDKNMNLLADIVYSIAQMEEKFFKELRKWVQKKQ
jgi:hypothetical protein